MLKAPEQTPLEIMEVHACPSRQVMEMLATFATVGEGAASYLQQVSSRPCTHTP